MTWKKAPLLCLFLLLGCCSREAAYEAVIKEHERNAEHYRSLLKEHEKMHEWLINRVQMLHADVNRLEAELHIAKTLGVQP